VSVDVSASRAYSREAPGSARSTAFVERAARVRIVLAVFVAFLAIGRITAPAGGGGEATPLPAPAQTGYAPAIPAQLTGPPPLEPALSERAAAERAELGGAPAQSVPPAGPAAPSVTTAVAAQSAQPAAAVEAAAGARAPAQPVGTGAPRPSRPAPALPHTSSGSSAGAGASFDSSG
jgi:hypothetical protein